MRRFSILVLILTLASAGLCLNGCGSPRDDSGPHTTYWRVAAAKREGAVVIYANTQRAAPTHAPMTSAAPDSRTA